MTKKRLYVILSFLFAAVFALVCAITLAACSGGKDDVKNEPGETLEGDPDETEDGSDEESSGHSHDYVIDADTWEWTDDTHTAATAECTCTNEDGLCEKLTETVYADEVKVENTATCEADGTETHVAYYGGKEVLRCTGHASGKLGHAYTVTFTWGEAGDDGVPTATADYVCANDPVHSGTGVTAEVTDNGDGTYTAKITLDKGYESEPYDPTKVAYIVKLPDSVTVYTGSTTTITATLLDGDGKEIEASGTFTWETDQGAISLGGETGATVTVTGIEATGNDPAPVTVTYDDGMGGTAQATVYVMVKKTTIVEGDPYSIKIDFSNSEDELASKFGNGTVVVDEKEVLTYVDSDAVSGLSGGGYLETQTAENSSKGSGYTNLSGSGYTNYLFIDFSEYVGYNFSINIEFAPASGSEGIMAVVENLDEGNGSQVWDPDASDGEGGMVDSDNSGLFGTSTPDLRELVTSAKGVESQGEKTTFTYADAVTDVSDVRGKVNEKLYIVWDTTMQIYSISIELWIGEKTVTLDESWEGIHIDFSEDDEELRKIINTGEFSGDDGDTSGYTGKVIEEGIFVLIDIDNVCSWTEGESYMVTTGVDYSGKPLDGRGYTSYDVYDSPTFVTNYFAINLYGLEGKTVTITAVFSTESGESGTMYITSGPVAFENEYDALTSGVLGEKSGAKDAKLSVAVTVPASGVLYIEWNTAVKIYSLDIDVGDNVDTVPVYNIEIDWSSANLELELDGTGTNLAAVVTENGNVLATLPTGATLTWTSSNPDVATVNNNGSVIVGSEVGTAYITVTFAYTCTEMDGDGNETVLYTIEITSGTVQINVDEPLDEDEAIRIKVDFANENKGWGTLIEKGETAILDDEGVVSYVSYYGTGTENYALGWKKENGTYVLQTGAVSSYGNTNQYGNYFAIDVRNCESMTLSVVFSSAFTGNNSEGYMALTDKLNSNGLYGAESRSTFENHYKPSEMLAYTNTAGQYVQVELSWEGDTASYDTLYLVYSTSMDIYRINLTLHGYTGKSEGAAQEGSGTNLTSINFDDETLRGSIVFAAGTDIALSDILTLHCTSTSNSIPGFVSVSSNDDRYALNVNSYVNGTSSTANTYFKIDVSEYRGMQLTFTIECGNDSNNRTSFLVLGTTLNGNNYMEAEGNGVLASTGSLGVTSKDIQTYTWTITVPDDCSTLYLYYASRQYWGYIYSINISIT